jgi:hypothetical protein
MAGDDVEITSKARFEQADQASTPDDLLEERGLDPHEWEIVNLVINEWEALTAVNEETGENEVKTLRQLKIHCKRKTPLKLILPARVPGNYIRPKPLRIRYADGGSKLVAFVGDQHVPKHDTVLHDLFLEWLEYNKPAEAILVGDTLDLPDVSKYQDNPEWDSTVQEGIDAGYLVLRDYVQASEGTSWKKLLGNHDDRLRDRLLSYHTRLYGVRRALVPGQEAEDSVWSIKNLLRLDELGIEVEDPAGDYEHAQIKVGPYLGVRHGWIVRKGSGASGLATLEHLGHSVVIGHVHRQSVTHKTVHDIDGNPKTLGAMEIGTMAHIDVYGQGYGVAPDWQGGWGTAQVWEDGTFKLDLATYVDGKLYWRDQRYS